MVNTYLIMSTIMFAYFSYVISGRGFGQLYKFIAACFSICGLILIGLQFGYIVKI
jgi:hypothetical protein